MRGLMALPTGRRATALGALGTYLYGTEQPNAEERKTPKEIGRAAHFAGNGFYPKDAPIDGIEGPKRRRRA
jgi:hypothetical protein